MLESLLLGFGFAFPSAIQPGPLLAFLFSRVTAIGWRRTLPAAFAPVLSDVPIALLVLLVLGRLPLRAQMGLRAAGGLVLLLLAWSVFRGRSRSLAATETGRGSAPKTLLQATLVNVLNPAPYLGWALVLGPSAEAAWHRHPLHAVALVGSFYGTMVSTIAALIYLFGTARFLSPRAQRVALAASGVVLAAIGVYQLAASVPRLLAP